MDIFDLQDPMEQNSSKLSDDFNPFDDMVAQIQQRQMQAEQMPPPAFIEELNPEQRQAVEQTEGPLLVLSGAGTGKTKVLTTRIAYIIHQRKAKPWEILAVTFTNKASKEMKSRLERMIGGDAFSVWLGTFHSIGIKILRKHGDRIGLDTNFIVLGSDDQERLLKQILTESGIDTKKYEPKTLLEIIQRWKDKGLQPHQVTANENSGWCNGMALPFYQRYQQRLKELNAVDFGDLLLLPLTLLQNHADVLEQYQNKFRYILVDEYQDTNVAQYLLLRLLAKKWRNICCVGDDDQSIYSWRGAEVENILSFQSIFPDSAVIRLERNYRSTGHILGAASGLIAHNSGRLGKTLRPADEQGNRGEKVLVKGFFNGKQEAEQIVDMIETEQRSGTKLSDMAILVRASFQTRLFEEVLIQHGVPYKIIGGFKFYEREEIKDAVAYLRLVHNPHDDLAFTRIINKPKRGIGAQALEALQTTAREKKISLFDSIAWAPLRPAVRKTLDSFVLLMKRAQEKLQTESLEDVAQMIMEDSGYLQMWRLDKSQSAEGRVENVQELYAVLKGFDSIQAFIEHATLVTDTDDTPTDEQLIVMTLHASKGLEFKNVYLPGWEDELFPHKKTLEESGDVGLEEERRLAYVGITRAKQKVMISYANNRFMYNHWVNALPSSFIDELPEDHIQKSATHSQNNYGYNMTQPAWGRSETMYDNHYASKKKSYNRYDDDDEEDEKESEKSIFDRGRWGRENSDEISHFDRSYVPMPHFKTVQTSRRIGRRVRHETFGNGTVIREEGERLDVRFDSGQVKKIMARFLTEI